MKTAAALLLAAGTCGAGFLAGSLIFRGDGTCKVQLPPTQPSRIDLPTEARAAAPVQELEKPVAAAHPESPLDGALSAPSREAAAPQFANLLSMPESTRIELKAKERAISETLPLYTKPAFAAQIAAGRVLSWTIAHDKPLQGDPDVTSQSGEADGPQQFGTTMDGEFTMRARDQAHGEFTVVLRRSEYPDLYELHDCLTRLRGQIREQERNEFTAKREEQNARMRK